MRFPFSLTRLMTGYLLKKRLAGQPRFPLVLMLEPLHACNLKCGGLRAGPRISQHAPPKASPGRLPGVGR